MKTGFFKQYGSLILFLMFLMGSVVLIPRAGEIAQPLIEFTVEHFKSEIIKNQPISVDAQTDEKK